MANSPKKMNPSEDWYGEKLLKTQKWKEGRLEQMILKWKPMFSKFSSVRFKQYTQYMNM